MRRPEDFSSKVLTKLIQGDTRAFDGNPLHFARNYFRAVREYLAAAGYEIRPTVEGFGKNKRVTGIGVFRK